MNDRMILGLKTRLAFWSRLHLILLPAGLLLAGCGGDGSPGSEPSAGSTKSATEAAQAADQEPLPIFEPIEGYGYQPRPCGFDLDDDGIIGEPEDCSICNGVETDPDGDGVDEDLIYISCDADGRDVDGCGEPGNPCASLAFAWNLADGPDDGAEDILCFRGSCRIDETLEPSVSGLDGIVSVPATGSQSRDFERAENPAMLVGWDSDGDGEYPPFDTDDIAELDGRGGAARGFRFGPVADRFEMAHFRTLGFGAGAEGKDSGLLAFGSGQGELSHVYLHDMSWIETNKGREAGASVTTVDLFSGKTRVRFLWLDNLWIPRTGGWLVRGSGLDQGPDGGPFRFENLTVTARGCDFDDCGSGAAFTGFHLWGYLSGIEILDSHFDAAVDQWQPKPKGGPSGARFALVAQCSRDWAIRHNRVVDFKNAVRIQGWAERYCDDGAARSVGPVDIDRNWISNDYAPWTGGDIAVHISEGGDDRGESVGDVRITHNILSAPGGWESCVWIRGGNDAGPPEGQITVAHNTCAGKIDYHGALVLGDTGGDLPRFPHPRGQVVGNLITGLRNEEPNVRVNLPLNGWRFDCNVYDSAGVFHLMDDVHPDLESWQGASGVDKGSVGCLPSFKNFERGDFSLTAEDACAADLGRAVEGVPALDQTGGPRPESVWDAGALQRVIGSPPSSD